MQMVNSEKLNTILDFIDHNLVAKHAQNNNNKIKNDLFNILRYKFIAQINTNEIKIDLFNILW